MLPIAIGACLAGASLLSLGTAFKAVWTPAPAVEMKHPGKGISLLVPYRPDHGRRDLTWQWLEDYYRVWLPGAELVMGWDDKTPFCKTAAVNRAFRRAKGDVIVILDADCYIDTDVIVECATRIREARASGKKLWYIPYRRFYRLTEAASDKVLGSHTTHPYLFPDPPPVSDLTSNGGSSNGHWYGALIQVMPKEAFRAAGGMDERFQGWGGEDIAFMHAVDTLYAKHKTFNSRVFHLWHPTIQTKYTGVKMWNGQNEPMNDSLAGKYNSAFGDREKMSKLIGDGCL